MRTTRLYAWYVSHISNISTKRSEPWQSYHLAQNLFHSNQTIEMTIDNIFYKRHISGGSFIWRHFAPASSSNTHWSKYWWTCSTKTHSTQLSRRLPPPVPVPCRHRLPIFIKQTFWDREKAHNDEQITLLSYITDANSRHQSVIQKIINNR